MMAVVKLSLGSWQNRLNKVKEKLKRLRRDRPEGHPRNRLLAPTCQSLNILPPKAGRTASYNHKIGQRNIQPVSPVLSRSYVRRTTYLSAIFTSFLSTVSFFAQYWPLRIFWKVCKYCLYRGTSSVLYMFGKAVKQMW